MPAFRKRQWSFTCTDTCPGWIYKHTSYQRTTAKTKISTRLLPTLPKVSLSGTIGTRFHCSARVTVVRESTVSVQLWGVMIPGWPETWIRRSSRTLSSSKWTATYRQCRCRRNYKSKGFAWYVVRSLIRDHWLRCSCVWHQLPSTPLRLMPRLTSVCDLIQ